MPSSSTMQRDISALDPTNPKHVGDQSFPITSGVSASTTLLSLNPSTSGLDPPPVPEYFRRDPVSPSGRGEGWPYAPQGWPKPDDKWGWRVGKRASSTSLWIDRYVTLPTSLLKGRRTVEFASRKSLVEYCTQNFPQMTHPYNIFKAFDWKVPAPKDLKAPEPKDVDVPEKRGPTAEGDKPPPVNVDDSWLKSKKQCRTVQDPEDEAWSPRKTQATLIADALKKVQEGAIITEVYKELIEQLDGLQAGRSRATGRERAVEDSMHPCEANLDKLAPHFISLGSARVPKPSSTSRFRKNIQSKSPVSTQQGGSNDASLALALTVSHGGDGVATISGTSLQSVRNVEPSDLLLCIPSLSSRLNQSVCKPPTLSIEEHVRECEAMIDRVKSAGQLNIPQGPYNHGI